MTTLEKNKRLTKTYEDGSFGVADNLPCGENSHEFKKLLIERLGEYESQVELRQFHRRLIAAHKIVTNELYKELNRDGEMVRSVPLMIEALNQINAKLALLNTMLLGVIDDKLIALLMRVDLWEEMEEKVEHASYI